MPYITICKAPDISDLGASLLSRAITSLVFHGREQPQSVVASRLLNAYLLVTDKSVREYTAGRQALIAYADSKNTTSLFVEGLGYFENCINSTKRAFRLLDRMATHPDSPAIDRTLRRLIQNWERRITPIRNAIEHIDGDIAAESVLITGMAHLLTINHEGDVLDIANHRIPLADLASTVRSLHHAGCELLGTLSCNTDSTTQHGRLG